MARFQPATTTSHGLRAQWDGILDEAFMVLVLDPPAMHGVRGIVRYRPELDEG